MVVRFAFTGFAKRLSTFCANADAVRTERTVLVTSEEIIAGNYTSGRIWMRCQTICRYCFI
jgi:hypothetical protein